MSMELVFGGVLVGWGYLLYKYIEQEQSWETLSKRVRLAPPISIQDAISNTSDFGEFGTRINFGYSAKPKRTEKGLIEQGRIVKVGLEGVVEEASEIKEDILKIPRNFANKYGKWFEHPVRYQTLAVNDQRVCLAYSNWVQPSVHPALDPFYDNEKMGMIGIGEIALFNEERVEANDKIKLIGIYVTDKVKELNFASRYFAGVRPGMLFVINSVPWHFAEITESEDENRMERFNSGWGKRKEYLGEKINYTNDSRPYFRDKTKVIINRRWSEE